jgi:hypothetical protein
MNANWYNTLERFQESPPELVKLWEKLLTQEADPSCYVKFIALLEKGSW